MELESNSLRLLAVTRAQGKVRELGVAEEHYPMIPDSDEPDALLLTAVGMLGDAAANYIEQSDVAADDHVMSNVDVCARYFDALLESELAPEIERELKLLAAASYFLAGRPGSSSVMAKGLIQTNSSGELDDLLEWVLGDTLDDVPHRYSNTDSDDLSSAIVQRVSEHFATGAVAAEVLPLLERLRTRVYQQGTSRDLLFADLVFVVVRMRLASSAWNTIPAFSDLAPEQWRPVFRKARFPKELWPSQLLIGQAGMFQGLSGAVVMPTSAGKTRAVEIILRSAFLAERAKLGVVVAPFRALSHEIATSLRQSFAGDGVRVNELSDALQLDFDEFLSGLLSGDQVSRPVVLVLTPEKLHYVLRQTPTLAAHIGVIVYDECHQFDSGARGVTYELLLTEISRVLNNCQTVLISAVMSNAREVADWVLGAEAQVVDGSQLMPTARAIAFASWSTRLGQLQVFDGRVGERPDYFVPRVIEQYSLQLRGREWRERVFPRKGDDAWKDVSLYLGVKLAAEGTVAIFCGRKDTANGLAGIIADAYERGLPLAPPVSYSDEDEAAKLWRLTVNHYGASSSRAIAARLGVFLHHSTTTHGLRLSIEHAMQNEQIRLVVCTSTLAQGVNLPIRYLIVSGTRQGADDIKVRDFQNLLGRAGRAGMHTEGLVVFANPDLYDQRERRRGAYASATGLLSTGMIEDMGSSLLETISPIRLQAPSVELPADPRALMTAIYAPREAQERWAGELATAYGRPRRVADIVKVLSRRRRELVALESHLMATRTSEDDASARVQAAALARHTLAYVLADEAQKDALEELFARVLDHVNHVAPTRDRQALYARTMLGAEQAARVFDWVQSQRQRMENLEGAESWLDALWDIYSETSTSSLVKSAEPVSALRSIAHGWISGMSYGELAGMSADLGLTKPYGSRRIKVSAEDIFTFCEQALSFEMSLLVAAVALALEEEDPPGSVATFQKCLKYGLPDELSITAYEAGIADRFLAQQVGRALLDAGFDGTQFSEAWSSPLREVVVLNLRAAPSWFADAVRIHGADGS